jgi:peptidoglycan hydrolase-like protein with peptidoglycan-binding domain
MEGLMEHRWLPRLGLLLACVVLCVISVISISHAATGDATGDKAVRIQQEALIWTTDYEGLIDGKPGDETIKAIRKFQARLGNPQTGTLTSSELEALVKQGSTKRSAAGFKQYTDGKAGVSVGIPVNFLPEPRDVPWGKSWYNREKGLAVDTLRFTNDVSLRALYDKLLKINNRTVTYQRYVDDKWFVIAAFEKDAAIYVRAELVRSPGQSDEIRGFSIWMSKSRPDSYQSIAPAMLSSFRSNTDTRRDVTPSISMGGPTIPADKPGGGIPPLIPNDPPLKSLTASGQASSATPCVDYKGLGDCPTVLTAK